MPKKDPLDNFATPQQFFLDNRYTVPLFFRQDRTATAVFQVEFYCGSLKTYCTQCREDSVFVGVKMRAGFAGGLAAERQGVRQTRRRWLASLPKLEA